MQVRVRIVGGILGVMMLIGCGSVDEGGSPAGESPAATVSTEAVPADVAKKANERAAAEYQAKSGRTGQPKCVADWDGLGKPIPNGWYCKFVGGEGADAFSFVGIHTVVAADGSYTYTEGGEVVVGVPVPQ